MGSVIAIAKRDFLSFFASMKGATIFFFFLIFMGFFFNSFVYTFVEMQQRAPMMGGQAPTLDQLLKALFYNLHFILLLVVPAVTMASFAEEKRAHTIRLLQTAPVSSLQIVFGKFLASTVLLCAVLLASSLYPIFTVIYGNPDPGPVWTSYVGVLLLISSQVAFGLWVSSMTKSQFMAFIFTMAGLFLLLILNWIAPNITGTGWLESFFKYAASTTHLDVLFKGMISVADVTYFVCFTALFLFFTNVTIDSQRWR